MIHVRDFFDKYLLKHPESKKITKSVYLVTEDLDVLKEALKKYDFEKDIFKKFEEFRFLELVLINWFIYF